MELRGNIAPVGRVTGTLNTGARITGNIRTPTSVNVTDYERLYNKPQINSVELIGNKSLPEIGVDVISNMELEELLQ